MPAQIVSITVGMPQTIDQEKPWSSGFIKAPVVEPLWLGSTNLAGDGQADTEHHGGPHKAVCVYPADHYPYWHDTLELAEFPWGSFGENFTVAGLTETDVCIGDVWAVGEVLVQVSQPRQPCWKLARRWQVKDLALQVQQTGRTGWYFRVLREGQVEAGMPITLAERSEPDWTVAVANHVMHHDKRNHDAAAALAAVPTLSPSWKETLNNRAARNAEVDPQKRLEG
ncbi:MOSC domain-containing protein [Roseimaritima ulvae]|uniref:6-N-hydroxylaminopurine resistance protein n=1 Tax=Roseimaritima ulvae TaxID=980254 RepID=A0A5B9QLT2_9BACT|nr:MOSC domain-containing protein [Roseimaritima ulvae]QEG38495.1 6-N-hydroxylaminopurine resistance protein [Roseimaritima ulvae]